MGNTENFTFLGDEDCAMRFTRITSQRHISIDISLRESFCQQSGFNSEINGRPVDGIKSSEERIINKIQGRPKNYWLWPQYTGSNKRISSK